MLPVTGIEIGVGGGLSVPADAQQRPKGVERVEAPVKAEGVFVEVRLKVLLADPVVAALQPAFEVAEHQMHTCLSG